MTTTRTVSVLVGALAFVASGCSSTVSIIEARGEAGSATVRLVVASCHQDPVAEVEETGTEIRISIKPQRGGNGDECADALTVTLDEPVGDRALVDGDTGGRVRLKPPEPPLD
ncbi:hypothetical protein [Nocardioides marinquilinus]|uniref:hypothetical protein n=1 Tax=Nocardioides marinquilinus TaxID=1210400 RepID=UPI0031E7944C